MDSNDLELGRRCRGFGPRVIKVIHSEQYRGEGTTESPIRYAQQYHTLEGELLAEDDPCHISKMREWKEEVDK